MAKGIRVNQLAKELGIESKSILSKCRDEGLGDKVPNHMSVLSIGLAETVREWFHSGKLAGHSGGGTVVETVAPVNLAVKPKSIRPSEYVDVFQREDLEALNLPPDLKDAYSSVRRALDLAHWMKVLVTTDGAATTSASVFPSLDQLVEHRLPAALAALNKVRRDLIAANQRVRDTSSSHILLGHASAHETGYAVARSIGESYRAARATPGDGSQQLADFKRRMQDLPQLDDRPLVTLMEHEAVAAADRRQVSTVHDIDDENNLRDAQRFADYRAMLEHPAIAEARESVGRLVRGASWSYRETRQASDAMWKVVLRNISPLIPIFLNDALTTLDYGYAAFEVVWGTATIADRTYQVPLRLKPLRPDYTSPLLDKDTGTFVGIRNRNCDLPADGKSLWLNVGNPDDTFTGVGYGRSRLENVRQLWQRWKAGEAINNIDRRLFDDFLGPGLIASMPATTVIESCRVALDRLLDWLLYYNFGNEAVGTIGLRIDLKPVGKDQENQALSEQATMHHDPSVQHNYHGTTYVSHRDQNIAQGENSAAGSKIVSQRVAEAKPGWLTKEVVKRIVGIVAALLSFFVMWFLAQKGFSLKGK